MKISDKLLAGQEVQLDYQTAIYLPKSDTVVIDCEIGCCYHTVTMQEFKEIYEKDLTCNI